jgi:XTP/dITP diphosphohydrolase
MKIVFATANLHKLEEVKAMLAGNLQIISLSDIGFTCDIPETEATLEGNALLKVRCIHNRYAVPCFADDTGLEVEALNGAPGVYSARYAGVKGSSEERAKANIIKLLHELSGKTNRKARFRTVIAYIDADNKEQLFEGVVNGKIIEEGIGDEGFPMIRSFKPLLFMFVYAMCLIFKLINLVSCDIVKLL